MSIVSSETVTRPLPAFPSMTPILVRVGRAFVQWRQAEAEHRIAGYLADIGGKFTDRSEREIERRMMGGL